MQKSNDYVSESSKTKEDSPSFNAKVERLAQSEPFQNIITSLFCHNVNANSDEGSSKVEINVGIPGEGGIGTSDLYAVMPPFEAFAGISAQLREKLFLQSLKIGMVLVGKVRSLNSGVGMAIDKPCGVTVASVTLDLLYCEDQVLSVDAASDTAISGVATTTTTTRRDLKLSAVLPREVARHTPVNRYIADLNISVVCDCDSMPSRRIMEATNDQIWRVVVKSIDWSSSLPGEDKTTPSSCTLKQNVRPQIMTHFLQMYTADHTKTEDNWNPGVSLGKKQYFFDNLSPSFKRTKLLEQDANIAYDGLLHKIVGFSNPKSHSAIMNSTHLVDCQVDVQQSVWVQLCRSHSNSKLRSAVTLRKNQNLKRALQSVGKGVTCFKEDKSVEAMQHFNTALEIDAECVEGLVARGALHAKLDVFPSAISDFKAALAVKSSHRNANKYLLETYLAFAQREESNNRLMKAEKLYREAQEFFGKNHETNVILVAAVERIEKLKLQQEEQLKAAQNLVSFSGGTDASPEKGIPGSAHAAKEATSELDSSFDTSITAKKIQKWLKREKQNLKKRKEKEKQKAEQEKETQKTPQKVDASHKRKRSRSRTVRTEKQDSSSRKSAGRKSSHRRYTRSRSRGRKSESIEVTSGTKSNKKEREKSPRHTNSGNRLMDDSSQLQKRRSSRDRCNNKLDGHQDELKPKVSQERRPRSTSRSRSDHKKERSRYNEQSVEKTGSKRYREVSSDAKRKQIWEEKTKERRNSQNTKLENGNSLKTEENFPNTDSCSKRKSTSDKNVSRFEKEVEKRRRKRSRSSKSRNALSRSNSRRRSKRRSNSRNRKSTSRRHRSHSAYSSSGSRGSSKSPNDSKIRISETATRSKSPKRKSLSVRQSNHAEERKSRKRSSSRNATKVSPENCRSISRKRKRISRKRSPS